MEMQEEALNALDTFGVPEYFTTHLGALEDAGSGMIRAIRCIRRNGVLIPVVSLVMPATATMRDGPRYQMIARRVAHEGLVAH